MRFTNGFTKFLHGLIRFLHGLTRFLSGLTKFSRGLTWFLCGLTKFPHGHTRCLCGLTKFPHGLTRFSDELTRSEFYNKRLREKSEKRILRISNQNMNSMILQLCQMQFIRKKTTIKDVTADLIQQIDNILQQRFENTKVVGGPTKQATSTVVEYENCDYCNGKKKTYLFSTVHIDKQFSGVKKSVLQ